MRSSKNVKSSVIATAAAVTIAVTGLAGTSNEVSTPIAPTTELIETATTEAIIATETEFVETVETATEAPSMELEVFSDLAANELPPEDMALYAGIVAAETYSWWDYQGYKMIADVIRNRVEHPAFAECTVRCC
jgi:spore germination cell wall hydrolase CwlJ-like protein